MRGTAQPTKLFVITIHQLVNFIFFLHTHTINTHIHTVFGHWTDECDYEDVSYYFVYNLRNVRDSVVEIIKIKN